MRVLYIDDDRVNALLFGEVCRLIPGVEAESAGSAAEALELVVELKPDLLVVDLHLPDSDGLSLLPRLWQAGGRRVPAYLCTADNLDEVEDRALGAGFVACWGKPLEIKQVQAQLRRHMLPAA